MNRTAILAASMLLSVAVAPVHSSAATKASPTATTPVSKNVPATNAIHAETKNATKSGAKADSISLSVAVADIPVYSFKQSRTLAGIPASLSHVGVSEMSRRRITTIKDFTSVVPNLYMPDFGSRLTSPIYIRGIGSKLNAPSVGLYVDGVPYYEKSTFDFDLSDVQSVEVLRGPQGTLYGRNTMGGIVNVFTRQPLSYKGTKVMLTGGSYQELGAAVSSYGAFTDNVGYGISARYGHHGGYFVNRYNGRRVDADDDVSASAKLRFRPDDRWDVTLFGNYQYSDQGGYPYAPYVDGRVMPVDYNAYSYYVRSLAVSGLSVNHTAPRFEMTASAGYQYFNDRQGLDQDFTPADDYYAIQRQHQHLASLEVRFRSRDNGSRYSWLAGASSFAQWLDKRVGMEMRDAHVEQNLPMPATQMMSYDTPSYGLAFFHQSVIDDIGLKGLSLVLGLRYDFEHSRMDYSMDVEMGALASHVSDFRHKLRFSEVMPKASLQYCWGNSSVYASVAEGYKAGGFNVSFDNDAERTYKPERSWNYEVGGRTSFLDGMLSGRIALFYIDWCSQQIQQPLADGIGTKLVNAGKSRSYGMEASVDVHPVRGLDINADWGFTRARFVDYFVSEGVDYSGNRVPFVPCHTLSASVDYTLACRRFLDRIVFSAQYNGVGSIYWNDANTVRQPFYGMLGARVSFQRGAFEVDVWGRNITATDYISYYFEALGGHFAQRGKPARFGVDIITRF